MVRADIVGATAVVMPGIEAAMVMMTMGIMMMVAVIVVMMTAAVVAALVHAGVGQWDVTRSVGGIPSRSGRAHSHDGNKDDEPDH